MVPNKLLDLRIKGFNPASVIQGNMKAIARRVSPAVRRDQAVSSHARFNSLRPRSLWISDLRLLRKCRGGLPNEASSALRFAPLRMSGSRAAMAFYTANPQRSSIHAKPSASSGRPGCRDGSHCHHGRHDLFIDAIKSPARSATGALVDHRPAARWRCQGSSRGFINFA